VRWVSGSLFLLLKKTRVLEARVLLFFGTLKTTLPT
jgi:hypothetical protein